MNDLPDGFKMTELGALPEEWGVVMLGTVTEFSRKPRSLNINKCKKIPFIPMAYIPDEKIYISKYDLKNQNEIKSGTFFYKSDLLVAKITPSFENGKQCIINDLPTDFGYATTEVWPLHGTDKCDILYLFYYLKKHEIRTKIAAKMEGSTGRQRVPKNVLANLEIPLPPLPEQHRIAAVLSAVQDAKEKTGAVIAAAKSLKKSLMRHLFTYGPVPAGAAESVVLAETEIGLVPEGWEVVRLGDVFKLTSGKSRPQDLKSIQSHDFVYPVYGGNGVMGYSKDFLIDFKTIVLGRVGEYCGSVHILKSESWISDNALYIKEFKMRNINLLYLALSLTMLNLNRLKKKSGQPLITQSIVYSQYIPLPPLPIQQKITNILSTVDKKIESEENKKKALDELFKSLLRNLMTGKIRVNHLEMPQ